jgi:hypothetical protein
MSNSNIIYLRKWFEETPTFGAAASLLRQHPRNLRIAEGILTVEDPFVRSVIIRTVREAVFAKPMPKVVKSNPDIWIFEARQ